MGKLVQSLNEKLLVLSKSLDVSLVSFDVTVQISDLGSLELDLLIQINFLLSNHIELIDLVLDDRLSLVEGGVDFLHLVHDLSDLRSSLVDRLITVLNLFREVVGEL